MKKKKIVTQELAYFNKNAPMLINKVIGKVED